MIYLLHLAEAELQWLFLWFLFNLFFHDTNSPKVEWSLASIMTAKVFKKALADLFYLF